jgi:uncharacterized protein
LVNDRRKGSKEMKVIMRHILLCLVTALVFPTLIDAQVPISGQLNRLCKAAYEGDRARVAKLLREGVDPNQRDESGKSPLYLAVSANHPEIVGLLLQYHAKPDGHKYDLLVYAAYNNYSETAKQLVLHGAQVNVTQPPIYDSPLVGACMNGNEALARLLVSHGAKINTYWKNTSPLMAASCKGPASLVKCLLSKGAQVDAVNRHKETALFQAIECSRPQIAKLLIEAGADVNRRNAKGDTPLIVAARASHIRALRMLISHGADLEGQSYPGMRPGDLYTGSEQTALMIASSIGAIDSVRVLVRAGASMTAVDQGGRNALMSAAGNGRKDVAEFLLKHGAGVNMSSPGGKTALIYAAMGGYTECVKMLLRHGADASIKDQDGKTALDYARKLGDPYLENALKYPKTK